MGVNAANAISDALDAAGYVVIHRHSLEKLGDNTRAVLDMLDGK